MEQKRWLDRMCIGLDKVAENAEMAQYAFLSDVYVPDPRFRYGSMIVGQNRGVLQVAKATGVITVIEAMPEDVGNTRFALAAKVIRRHWEAREFPDRTMGACG